jgi:hypothetical protein
MSVDDPDEGRVTSLIEGLQACRARLFAAISGVTEEQFKRRPEPTESDPDPWSIAEVLAHLLASERLRGDRIAMALDHDGVTITPSSPEAHEEGARAGRRVLIPQLVHGVLASRREVERQLARGAASEGGIDRAVLHPVLGRQTVEWMVGEKIIAHESEHAGQIEGLRGRLGIPHLQAAREEMR